MNLRKTRSVEKKTVTTVDTAFLCRGIFSSIFIYVNSFPTFGILRPPADGNSITRVTMMTHIPRPHIIRVFQVDNIRIDFSKKKVHFHQLASFDKARKNSQTDLRYLRFLQYQNIVVSLYNSVLFVSDLPSDCKK